MREIEVKAKLRDKEGVMRKLVELGCRFSEPVTQKDSIFIEPGLTVPIPPGRTALRIREQDGKYIFTLKQSVLNQLDCLEKEVAIDRPEEMKEIIKRSARLLNMPMGAEALDRIAQASRFTPRIANRLLKRVRDYAQVKNQRQVSGVIAQEALTLLGIDELGLEATDRKILLAIAQQFGGGPVGVKSIAATIGEEEETIEDVYEPYLMRLGFLTRTARGRMVTEQCKAYLKLSSSSPPLFT